MRLRAHPLLALAVLVLAGVLVTAAFAAPPTGDRQAIAYYNKQSQAWNGAKGAKIVESGYLYATRRGRGMQYIFGQGKPAGFVSTPDTVLYRLANGVVKSYLVTAHGGGLTYRLLYNAGKIYLNYNAPCWQKLALTAAPHGHGGGFIGLENAKVRPQSSPTTVVYSYPWGKTATATETDVFGGQTPPTLTTTIRWSGTVSGTFHQQISSLAAAPRLPAPQPLCR
jgi:hypothetical protein